MAKMIRKEKDCRPEGERREMGYSDFNLNKDTEIVKAGGGEDNCHKDSPVCPPVYYFLFPQLEKPHSHLSYKTLGGDLFKW